MLGDCACTGGLDSYHPYCHCRRLCILKGIHPREPKRKHSGQNKTYYHVKDVSYLLHEPLLAKARELAAYDKKVCVVYGRVGRGLWGGNDVSEV